MFSPHKCFQDFKFQQLTVNHFYTELISSEALVFPRLCQIFSKRAFIYLQVLFDVTPESQNLDRKGFDELKLGNKLRHEILTEILSSLGLNCEPNRTLSESPVHLLATSKVRSCSAELSFSQNSEGLLSLCMFAVMLCMKIKV